MNKKKNKKSEHDDMVNFMDSASGIRFFRQLKGNQNKKRFVGSVLIRFQDVQNTAIIDFVEKFLDEENISYSMSSNYYSSETRIVAKNYNMPFKEDASKILDKCILLNTYLKKYFEPMGYISKYDICYQLNCYEEKEDMYLEAQKINFDNFNCGLDNALFINELVYINTRAKEKEPELNFQNNNYCEYDYLFTRLAKNLEREVEA